MQNKHQKNLVVGVTTFGVMPVGTKSQVWPKLLADGYPKWIQGCVSPDLTLNCSPLPEQSFGDQFYHLVMNPNATIFTAEARSTSTTTNPRTKRSPSCGLSVHHHNIRVDVAYMMRVTGAYNEPLGRQIMERVQISNFPGPVLMNRRNEMGGIRKERTGYRRWGGDN